MLRFSNISYQTERLKCAEIHAFAEESKERLTKLQEQFLKRTDDIVAVMTEKHRAEVGIILYVPFYLFISFFKRVVFHVHANLQLVFASRLIQQVLNSPPKLLLASSALITIFILNVFCLHEDSDTEGPWYTLHLFVWLEVTLYPMIFDRSQHYGYRILVKMGKTKDHLQAAGSAKPHNKTILEVTM